MALVLIVAPLHHGPRMRSRNGVLKVRTGSRKVAPAKRHQARSGPLSGSEAYESAQPMQVRRIRWIPRARVSSKPVDSTKYYLPSHPLDESEAATAHAFGTRQAWKTNRVATGRAQAVAPASPARSA